ncbi:uncharacterized protein M6B38_359275 [Iris pallida]|uniref:Myb/SANT-like domain-containing protein n=1 Tax=Iris pallida TaxID=29817 RepID=A0AAX6GL10_IRIPA|nr:uncharacterized protein M6B38_359275 [Iris pallida]
MFPSQKPSSSNCEAGTLTTMKFERPQARTEDQVHSVRITLSSKNVKNLDKVCAELVSGAKDKRLEVNGDKVMSEKVSPITTRCPYEPGFRTRRPYRHQTKKVCSNFRWSPELTRFLLPFLIDQAKVGFKMGRSSRKDAFQAAAEAVKEKFNLRCTYWNVENHVRTIKTRFQQIRKLQSLSNTIWDEKERKIMMDGKDYAKYIAANPRDEPFLNRHIELYDEMVFVCEMFFKCGNDHTFDPKENHPGGFDTHEINGGNHEITVGEDVNIFMDDEDLGIEEVGEATPTIPPPSCRSPQPPPSKSPAVSTSSSSSRSNGKGGKRRKSHHIGDKLDYLACQIGELAEAIRSSHRGFSAELFSEIMKCEGYDEASLGKAFDYLNEHENVAKGFLVKNGNLRQAWLSEFFSLGNQVL